MAQVHVDPEKLRRFAGELRQFTEVINNYFNLLSNEMNRLGSSWQDQEYEKFKRGFAPSRQMLQKFADESKKIVPLLEKDATDIEEYLKRSR
ncbi:WXG100 family type VII secretion target [Thermodesulfovibrionales bacterium]|nr:WXG100 family type VII secretion target [Thermodesulfovibrionales bacterium]MCL0105880.1 WXG100 family type VII secretion target [Thermodesulfovibrionales bacterium]